MTNWIILWNNPYEKYWARGDQGSIPFGSDIFHMNYIIELLHINQSSAIDFLEKHHLYKEMKN